MIKTKKIVWKSITDGTDEFDGYIDKTRLFKIRKSLLIGKWFVYIGCDYIGCNSIRQAKFQAKKLLQNLVEEKP